METTWPLTKGVILQHRSMRAHTAKKIKTKLGNFGWEILDHPSYSSDFAPLDFHLLEQVKRDIIREKFEEEDELQLAFRR